PNRSEQEMAWLLGQRLVPLKKFARAHLAIFAAGLHSLFLVAGLLRRRQARDCHVDNRVPCIVDADVHEQKTHGANYKKGLGRTTAEHDAFYEESDVRDQWQHDVPDPIGQNWLVLCVTARSIDNDERVDRSDASASTDSNARIDKRLPWRAQGGTN